MAKFEVCWFCCCFDENLKEIHSYHTPSKMCKYFLLLLILRDMYTHALWEENSSQLGNCSVHLENSFTSILFLTMMHTALFPLLRALSELKKKEV